MIPILNAPPKIYEKSGRGEEGEKMKKESGGGGAPDRRERKKGGWQKKD